MRKREMVCILIAIAIFSSVFISPLFFGIPNSLEREETILPSNGNKNEDYTLRIYQTNDIDIYVEDADIFGSVFIGAQSIVKFRNVVFSGDDQELIIEDDAVVYFENVEFSESIAIQVLDNAEAYFSNVEFMNTVNINTTGSAHLLLDSSTLNMTIMYLKDYSSMTIENSNIVENINVACTEYSVIEFMDIDQTMAASYITLYNSTTLSMLNFTANELIVTLVDHATASLTNVTGVSQSQIHLYDYSTAYIAFSNITQVFTYLATFCNFMGPPYGSSVIVTNSTVYSMWVYSIATSYIYGSNIDFVENVSVFEGNVVMTGDVISSSDVNTSNIIWDQFTTVNTISSANDYYFRNSNVTFMGVQTTWKNYYLVNSTALLNNAEIISAYLIDSELTGENSTIFSDLYAETSAIELRNTNLSTSWGFFEICDSTVMLDNCTASLFSFEAKGSEITFVNVSMEASLTLNVQDSWLALSDSILNSSSWLGYIINSTVSVETSELYQISFLMSYGNVYNSSLTFIGVDYDCNLSIVDSTILIFMVYEMHITGGSLTLNSTGIYGTGTYEMGATLANTSIYGLMITTLYISSATVDMDSVDINEIYAGPTNLTIAYSEVNWLYATESYIVLNNVTIYEETMFSNATVEIYDSRINSIDFMYGTDMPLNVYSDIYINNTEFNETFIITNGNAYINNSNIEMMMVFLANVTLNHTTVTMLMKGYGFNGTGQLINNVPSGDYVEYVTVDASCTIFTESIGIVGGLNGTLTIRNTSAFLVAGIGNSFIKVYNTSLYQVFAFDSSTIILNDTQALTFATFNDAQVYMSNVTLNFITSYLEEIVMFIANNSRLFIENVTLFVNITYSYGPPPIIIADSAQLFGENFTYEYYVQYGDMPFGFLVYGNESRVILSHSNVSAPMVFGGVCEFYNTRLSGVSFIGGLSPIEFKIINNETFINSTLGVVTGEYAMYGDIWNVTFEPIYLVVQNAALDFILLAGNTTAEIENVTLNTRPMEGPISVISYYDLVQLHAVNLTASMSAALGIAYGFIFLAPCNDSLSVTYEYSTITDLISYDYFVDGAGYVEFDSGTTYESTANLIQRLDTYTNCDFSTAINVTNIYIDGFIDANISGYRWAPYPRPIGSLLLFRQHEYVPPYILSSTDNVTFEVDMTVPQVTFTITEDHPDYYELLLNGTVIESGSYTTGKVVTFDPNMQLPSDGYFQLILWANDTEGNFDSKTVEITRHPAESPVITNAPTSVIWTNETPVPLSWTAEDIFPDNYTLYVNGTKEVEDSWSSGVAVTYNLDKADGVYNVTIIFYDEAGHFNKSTVFVHLDTVVPVINVISIDDTFELGETDAFIEFNITDDNPAYYQFIVDGNVVINETYVSGEHISINLTEHLTTSGNHTVRIVAYDKTGSSSDYTRVVEVYPAEAPEIVVGPEDEYTVDINETLELVWNVVDSTPSYYEIYVNGTLVANGTWTSGVNITYSFVEDEAGTYMVEIKLYDEAGHVTTDTVTVIVREAAPPPPPGPPIDIITIGIVIGAIVIIIVIVIMRRR